MENPAGSLAVPYIPRIGVLLALFASSLFAGVADSQPEHALARASALDGAGLRLVDHVGGVTETGIVDRGRLHLAGCTWPSGRA